MPYRIAGIDVHKKKLAVVVTDVEIDDEYQFERRWYGANPEQLELLAQWMFEQQVEEVVMESTARYWTPVWAALEQHWRPVCRKREGCRADVGHIASCASLVQSWAARADEGLSRCGTFGKAADLTGANLELRARCRTAPVAEYHAHKVPTDA